jgi:PAS domain S-box-containing protein
MASTRRSGILVLMESEETVAQTHPTLLNTFRAGFRSLMSVPLISNDQVIGVLVLQASRENAYTEMDLKLAEKVGNQIAGAIANVQLFAERKRAEEVVARLAQENAVMAEIGRIISSTLNVDEVYERFAGEVRKLIPFDRIAVSTINPKESSITVAYAWGVDIPKRKQGKVLTLIDSFSKEIISTRSGILIQNTDENELAERYPDGLLSIRAGFRSIMSVPLVSKDHVIGILHIRSLKPEVYTESDLRLAERVGNQIAGAIANARLYVERKQMGDALRKSEERFRDLYDHAPLGYHEYDAEGRITNVNRTDLEMLGYTAEEMIGHPMWEFNIEGETAREQILAKLAGTLLPGRNLERLYRKKDGTTIPVLIEDRLILDEKGRISGIRCTIQDITARKQVEDERESLKEQLRQSQKMEAIGKLAGGVAHDFNNLLTVIQGYGELLLNSLDQGSRLRQDVQEIMHASERASSLTRQLLAFSRKQVLQPKVLDLNAHVSNMDKMLRRMIGEDIELVTLLAEDLGRIKADPGQIEQAILNLAVNAKDAMLNGGKLTIETANVKLDENYARSRIGVIPGDYVMLSMSDTGGGMAPETKERIFEPFFTTKEKGKGTGLGLSTVYGIVQQSGGNIWVYSEPGLGTTFKIYLPRIEEGTESLRPAAVPTKSLQGSETVLLVEDEEMVRKLACTVLEKNGYTVLEASNGDEALDVVQGRNGNPIHLVVTDVVMPGMSGRQLADRLVSLRPELKVLYMSGYTDNAIVHHGVLDPGIAYIQKPFTPDALASKVREILDGN